MRKRIVITPEGELRFIYADMLLGLLALGAGQIVRASHVEPTSKGQWTADLTPVGGPRLGPYPLRSLALQAEEGWLRPRLAVLAVPFRSKEELPHA